MSTSSESFPLTIFCGKGGVGKTSLALAFALRHARQDCPVLVCTSHPLAELAVSISLAGLKEARPEAAANLFIIHIDPYEILGGKIKQAIPSEMLVKKILASPIYKSLIEVAPGLKEIAFLGRLHQLSEDRVMEGVARKFRLVVWDAPATGHFLQTLQVSRNFETYLSGPFALLGKQVAEFFSDVSNFSIFPVACLEEMAVDETIDLYQALAGELSARPAGVICNMVSPLLATPEIEIENLRQQMAQAGPDYAELQFVLDRHGIERALFAKLRSSIDTKFYTVHRKASWNSDLELLLDISNQLGELSRT